jgi:hypothetical protein
METMTNNIPLVDEWNAEPSDIIFTNAKNIIMAPIGQYFKVDDQSRINFFMINPKKSYNSDLLRDHTCTYLNYFEKYFDTEKEYFTNLAQLKFLIDNYMDYNINNFMYDINRYLIQPSLFSKIANMVEFNYSLTLSYKSANNPQLQYTNEHAKILMQISIMMNLCIPIITHFAYMRKISDIDEFLLDIYDNILYAPHFSDSVNIISKLYETGISNVNRNAKNNAVIWAKQDIRGKDVITHSEGAVRNIILNIIPKYTFSQNMVSLNYTSIQKSNKFQITDIQYEYSYVTLSSSKREGEDNTSDFDRYESNLQKTDQSLYLQTKFNYEYTMKVIENDWGPYDPREIEFYRKELSNDNGSIMNTFQRQLIFNLFYKYFGDTISPKAINNDDYIKLMLSAKKMLLKMNMNYLPYIISAKVNKIVSRKTLNKKELAEMESSQYFKYVEDKYKNPKILQQILGTIATIITSNFSIIDYKNKDIHGLEINIDSRFIIEETLIYILLI